MPSVFSRQTMFRRRKGSRNSTSTSTSKRLSMMKTTTTSTRYNEEEHHHDVVSFNACVETKYLNDFMLQDDDDEKIQGSIRKNSSQTQSSWGSRSRTSPIPIYPKKREPKDPWSPTTKQEYTDSSKFVVLMNPALFVQHHNVGIVHHGRTSTTIPELPSLSQSSEEEQQLQYQHEQQLHLTTLNDDNDEEGQESRRQHHDVCRSTIIERNLFPCTYPEPSTVFMLNTNMIDSNARRGSGECYDMKNKGRRSRSHNFSSTKLLPRETCNRGIPAAPASTTTTTAGLSSALSDDVETVVVGLRSNLYHSLSSYEETTW